MEIVDRMWQLRLARAVESISTTQPHSLKVRVFGSPSRAQERLAEAIEALRANGYGFARADTVAHSPFFTISDAYFRRASEP